jgi:probable F420-dependent oxidoreductase
MRLQHLDRANQSSVDALAPLAAAAESDGFAGLWCGGSRHDPFLMLAQIAGRHTRLRLGTGVAIAFARSPMVTAVMANDLHAMTEGRFVLGLGSQIRAHIVRRFSMPWSHPAARMREYVEALRAIWDCWREGTPLNFEGDFYRFTLMTPHFNPGPNAFGNPKVLLGALGERMTEVAGAVADGLIVHDFVTPEYLRRVTTPAFERGRAAASRSAGPPEVVMIGMVVTGRDEQELAEQTSIVRQHVAFYASTPAYRPVLQLHGYDELHAELHAMSRRGDWSRMAGAVPDELVREVAVVAEPARLASAIVERYGDLVDRFTTFSDAAIDWNAVVDDFRSLVITDALSPAR